jgi:ATP-binding cassette, subfamily B, bacterial PglK
VTPTKMAQWRALLGVGRRGRWAVVIGLALVVSALEGIGALLVLAVLALLAGGPTSDEGALGAFTGTISGRVSGADDQLVALAGLVAGFFVVRGIVTLIQSYLQYRVAENAGARLSSELLERYLEKPYTEHLQRNSSEAMRNASQSVLQFVDEGLVPGVKLVSKSAVVIGVLSVLTFAAPGAALVAVIVLGPSLYLILRLLHPRIVELGREVQRTSAANIKSLQQCLHGVREIKVLGRTPYFLSGYTRDRQQFARARYLRRAIGEVPRVVIETGVILFILGFLILSDGGAAENSGTLPTLGLFGYAAVRIMPELNQISTSLNSIRFAGPAVEDLYRDLKSDADVATNPPAVALRLDRELRLEDVSFTYPGATRPSLTDVRLSIQPGEHVGIVGSTGSGKTTLTDVILGLLPPSSGTVLVDDRDIHEDVASWQSRIGVVPQMGFILDDSLRRNIAFGVADPDIIETDVIEALETAQLGEFVAGLPEGLDTEVGERGVRISGGQRQRVAIARALYHRPSVLIFDEGTSALDNATEAALIDALEAARRGRTVITVAHRISTVRGCDRVVLMNGGRIVDVDTFAALAARHENLLQ